MKMVEIVCGSIKLKQRQVFWHDIPIKFTKGEFDILQFLIQQNDPVSYRELYDIIKGKDFIAEGINANIRSFIKRIRNKFRKIDSKFDHIETFSSFGYYWRKAVPINTSDYLPSKEKKLGEFTSLIENNEKKLSEFIVFIETLKKHIKIKDDEIKILHQRLEAGVKNPKEFICKICSQPQSEKPVLELGVNTLFYKNLKIRFPPRQAEILYVLCKDFGHAILHEKLELSVYGSEDVDARRCINVELVRIRKAFKKHNITEIRITTINTVGHVFEFSDNPFKGSINWTVPATFLSGAVGGDMNTTLGEAVKGNVDSRKTWKRTANPK